MNAAPALLEVSDLCVFYGKNKALADARLQVAQGKIVTVIGPNGAGKTTLLSAIVGALPSSGKISFANEAMSSLSVAQRVAKGLCLVPEKRALFSSLSVEDNLRLGAFRFHRRSKHETQAALAEQYLRFPKLEERRRQMAGTLSGGERQMLALARALMSQPRLLMLDEPSLGLAPRITRDMFVIIAELRRSGVSILLVEQNARAALKLADYAYVLELGRIVMEGAAEGLIHDPRVIAAYLGQSKTSS